MKNTMFKSLVIMLFVGFLAASLASVNASESAEETVQIKGTIVSIDTTAGKVEVRDEAGNAVNLVAGHDVDLTTCSEGDQVSIECTNDGVIKSITKT